MTNPLEYFLHWEKAFPNDIIFRQAAGTGWKTWTHQQAGDEIRKIAAYLKSLNLPAHSKIAILSKNCPHWVMADLAIMMSGHVSVPLYPTLHPEAVHDILVHSEAKAIFIGKLDDYKSQLQGGPALFKIGIEAYGVSEVESWEKVVSSTAPLSSWVTLNPEDIMTIVYTSGTTGNPKGVMHAFKSFHATLTVARKELSFPERPRLFSYLPMSHIAERIGIKLWGCFSALSFPFQNLWKPFPEISQKLSPATFSLFPEYGPSFRKKSWRKFQNQNSAD